MQITLTLFVDDTPLEQRKCRNCDGTEFRAIKRTLAETDHLTTEPIVSLSICLTCHQIYTLM